MVIWNSMEDAMKMMGKSKRREGNFGTTLSGKILLSAVNGVDISRQQCMSCYENRDGAKS